MLAWGKQERTKYIDQPHGSRKLNHDRYTALCNLSDDQLLISFRPAGNDGYDFCHTLPLLTNHYLCYAPSPPLFFFWSHFLSVQTGFLICTEVDPTVDLVTPPRYNKPIHGSFTPISDWRSRAWQGRVLWYSRAGLGVCISPLLCLLFCDLGGSA